MSAQAKPLAIGASFPMFRAGVVELTNADGDAHVFVKLTCNRRECPDPVHYLWRWPTHGRPTHACPGCFRASRLPDRPQGAPE